MSGQRKYSMELRERATRMALEARADPSRRKGAIKRIGGQLGINPEAGVVRKLLTVCLCGFCPGRLV